jgi:NAD-dependent dihydropyrimidine dehydrogenase PreA subunit
MLLPAGESAAVNPYDSGMTGYKLNDWGSILNTNRLHFSSRLSSEVQTGMHRTEMTYHTVWSMCIECKNCIRITAWGMTPFFLLQVVH